MREFSIKACPIGVAFLGSASNFVSPGVSCNVSLMRCAIAGLVNEVKEVAWGFDLIVQGNGARAVDGSI